MEFNEKDTIYSDRDKMRHFHQKRVSEKKINKSTYVTLSKHSIFFLSLFTCCKKRRNDWTPFPCWRKKCSVRNIWSILMLMRHKTHFIYMYICMTSLYRVAISHHPISCVGVARMRSAASTKSPSTSSCINHTHIHLTCSLLYGRGKTTRQHQRTEKKNYCHYIHHVTPFPYMYIVYVYNIYIH